MKVIKPSVSVAWIQTGDEMLKNIEIAGRIAYKSEDQITADSASAFAQMIIARGHLSVLEHVSVSARVICDRGVSHEIVRHRIASYTQESTRYCNYSKDKHGSEITVVLPYFLRGFAVSPKLAAWRTAMETAESQYFELCKLGCSPQEARSVLPNSLKTEIVMTMNLREWRHFFTLRTAKAAHPDMQVIAKELLDQFQKHVAVVFDNFD